MVGKLYVYITICTLAVSIEAKTINIASSYSYIFNLELKFNEEKINDYIIDSFFATNGEENNKLLHCDITLSDILRAIPYKKLAISDFTTAVNELNLSLTVEDIGNLISNLDYNELSAMGFSMARLQKVITKTYFKNKPAALLECLNILGISEEYSVAVAFGTDEDLFKAFQSANFSYDNLVKIRNIINTPTTLKDILNILGVKKYNQIYLENFINSNITPLLFENGLAEDNLKQFLKSLNVSVGNYKNSKTFKTCYNTITSGNTLAVAVSENEIITNDDSVILKYLNLEQYATLIAKNIQDEEISYTISADNIDGNRTDNVISIKVDAVLPSFIEETNTYSDVTNKFCSYISLDDDELEIQNIAANFVDDQLVISKLYNTVFKKGSPLVCGQKLYGLASVDKTSAIVFDTFEDILSEEISSIPEHYKPEIINIIKEFFEDLKANFDPCKYNLCGSDNEGQEDITSNNDETVTNAAENPNTPEENNENNDGIVGNDDSNNYGTEGTDVNPSENIDDNTLGQNEEESETSHNDNINNEEETVVTDELDQQNDISNDLEGNVEDHSNIQGDTSLSQEVTENGENIVNPNENSQEPEDNQSNVDDSNPNPEQADDNETGGDSSNPPPQESGDNQENVINVDEELQEAENNQENDINQETQEANENQENGNDVIHEPQDAGNNQENVNDANQEPQEENDNQEIVNDINQQLQEANDNQEDANDIPPETQETDGNQVNANDANQEAQEIDDNQVNVDDVNQETQEGNGEGPAESNQGILEGRTA